MQKEKDKDQADDPHIGSGPLPLTGLILAGGASSRMGHDKALLSIEGEPLLCRLVRQLAQHCGEVIVATGTQQRGETYAAMLAMLAVSPLRYAIDRYPDSGPLAGLESGLSMSRTDYVFVLACDMPEFSEHLLARQCQLLHRACHREADAQDAGVVQVIHVPGQPFHALYHSNVAQAARVALAKGQKRMLDFIQSLHTLPVPLEEEERARLFVNLNTPEAWRAYTSGKALH